MAKPCSNAYCRDLIQYLSTALDAWTTSVPILFQFGDIEDTLAPPVALGAAGQAPRLPLWKRFAEPPRSNRHCMTKAILARVLRRRQPSTANPSFSS